MVGVMQGEGKADNTYTCLPAVVADVDVSIAHTANGRCVTAFRLEVAVLGSSNKFYAKRTDPPCS
jgi:hypothetical protein